MYNVRSEGQYRVDGGDWSVNDPDPEAGTYDPEAGDQTTYQDPEAPPPPQPKRHKPKLTVVTSEPQSLFFNTSSLPQDTENTQDIEASSTSNTYSFAQQPHVPSGAKTTKASSSSSSSRIMKDSFGSSLSGGTAPILNASMSPHEAIKQVPHQIQRNRREGRKEEEKGRRAKAHEGRSTEKQGNPQRIGDENRQSTKGRGKC